MLNINQLIGFGAGGGDPLTLTYRSSRVNSADITSESGTMALGTPTGNPRYVIVCVALTAATASSITATLNGTAMTKLLDSTDYGEPQAVFILRLDTGTSATVAWAADNSFNSSVVVYTLHGAASSTPVFTSKTSPSISVTSGVGSVCVGFAWNGAATSWTWTGLVEDTDFQDPEDGRARSSASKALTASPLSVVANPLGDSNNSLLALAWR